ncbi:hypothetical protein D3C71_2072440 [compost metagenome]
MAARWIARPSTIARSAETKLSTSMLDCSSSLRLMSVKAPTVFGDIATWPMGALLSSGA